ncbi:penicillin-binding protein 1A [soil metagenome]
MNSFANNRAMPSSEEELNLPVSSQHHPLKALFWLAMAVALVATITAIGIVQLKSQLKIGDAALPTLRDSSAGIQFFDRNNKYMCTVRADRDRQPVSLDKVSPNMRNALMSAEDHHFMEHHGIDFIGVARAFKRNREAGRIVEGGSTITQQLVRNLYLDKNDRSYTRKIKEVFLSWDAENRFSKAKIMETYLNEIYFGSGVYGIERAANSYFNKHASLLNIGESAFIAGLIKSPSVYGNPANQALAIERQHEVLDKMAEYGYISQDQATSSKAEKLAFKRGADPVKYPYYIAYALEQVKKEMGENTWTQNLKVYTNLDQAAQKAAIEKLTRGIKTAPRGVNQGALVSMNVSDGAVIAMVGGVGDYEDNQWNRALYPHTAGSCFKPFVYLAGLMNGILEPDTMVNDEPLSMKEDHGPVWKPKNFDSQFKGWVTVRDALINSRNICAIRIALATGIQPVIDAARAAGLTSKMDAYPSLALGTCAVSPLEMATAYSTLARNGVYLPPQVIREIDTADGKDNRKFHATPSGNLPASSVAMLVDVMQDVVNRGTGTQARLAGIPVAGKTGTADGARDIWFSGFTPDTVTTVWGGSDKNQAIKGHNVTGGTIMAHIWKEYMTAYYKIHKPTKALAFSKPENKFAGPLPELNDETLLTTDASSVDVTDLEKLQQVDPLSVNPNQIANNVPVILSNAIEAKEKGIGKAFIVLAAEAAERFQRGGGAYAHQNTAYAVTTQPLGAQAAPVVAQGQVPTTQSTQNLATQSYSSQPTAEQMAYAQQMLSMQANQSPQPQQY